LVVVAPNEHFDALRIILDGFQLVDWNNDSLSAYQHYSASIITAKQAALKREIRPVQLLAEHIPTVALK
jgi:hypothetical protein